MEFRHHFVDCVIKEGNTGALTSPNYPNDYPHNYYNCWKISVSSGTVNIEIKDFNMEYEGRCNYDYFQVPIIS